MENSKQTKFMKKITILLSLLTLILSCSSNDDNGNENEQPTSEFKLVKVEQFDNDNNLTETTTYEYDQNFRLFKSTEIDSENSTRTYNYSGNKITSINLSSGETINYTYNGDLITNRSNVEDGITFTDEYEYNSANQLISETSYENGNFQCEKTWTYNSQDNIATASHSCFTGTKHFEYDNKKNPNDLLFNSGILKTYEIGHNNITQISDENSNITQTRTYEYNSQGYPIVEITNIGSFSFRTEYTYETLSN
ncbi:hypothetical protein [Algibacter sp. PT7-4]|uniref:hypothetical protein n=1 Tax=Algibacter ulvanivorans TaxID=3400999 RepID=UPI003AAAA1B4